jgi:hypothetical protein
MKNLSFLVTILLSMGGVFSSCLSDQQKKEAADAKVVTAQDNLNKVQRNADSLAHKVATAQELTTFKLQSDLKTKNNEVLIAELKLKMNKSGVVSDSVYAHRIDSLEQKNKDLKLRMSNYEITHSNWAKFKSDVNRDLNDIGLRLKEYANENLK